MAPRPDVSEERRTQILDAAMDTFSEKGIHKTRMSDIADKSGLSKGSLYWYFDSKDAIVLNLLEKIFEPEIKDLERLLSDPRNAEERLHLFAERGGQDVLKLMKWMPLVYDFIALAFRQEVIRKAISQYYKRNIDLLERIVQQGIDSGEFRDVNALDTAIAIGAIFEGTIVLYFYDPENINIRERIDTNLGLFLKGIKKPR